jgi:hypothetical protein
MRLKKGYMLLAAFAVAIGASAFFLAACEEDVPDTTRPKVEYKDQTFALLVCDGNGNDEASWDHDGAPLCTLDWNGDNPGPNRVPVTYVYDRYPLIDGVAENLSGKIPKAGDYWLWQTTPTERGGWTVINTGPIIGKGSGVKQVEVKALYTYVNPPRIWFFFRWEDPSHTIQPIKAQGPEPVGGTHHYYWLQKGGMEIPGDGFTNNRQWKSHEDWLALVWSTWFLWNTKDKGKGNKDTHAPANPDGYDWLLVETVPGFQTKGLNLLKGSGDVVYRTPPVTSSDPNSPYYDKYYPGPICDLWYFSASRTNYTPVGSWSDEEAAYLFDCYIDNGGFKYPPVGSNDNDASVDEWLTFDSGIAGIDPNGRVRGQPGWQAPGDPEKNPPGPYYLWSAEETISQFSIPANWTKEGGARIPGYLHRPALGSVGDIICRCQWQFPGREFYEPWEGAEGQRLKKNYYGKDWHYTLEIMREIGTITKIDPEEDVLLGLFDPHPGK